MTKIKKLKSGSWHSLVYAGTNAEGKREYKSITAPTKAECEYLVAEFKKQKQKTDVLKNKTTVRQAVEKYIANNEVFLSPNTIRGYEIILNNSFKELMETPCDKLTQKIVDDAIKEEMKKKGKKAGSTISPKTVCNRYGLISPALKAQGYRFDVRLPKVHKKNKLLVEPQEITNIIKGTNIELPCLLAMWMSLREGEIMGLTLDSIHGDFLTVDKTRNVIKGRTVVKDYTKTDESTRVLKIPPYILNLIHNTDVWKNRTKLPKNTFLFDYTGNALYRRFKKLTLKNGIDMTFHDLRHYFASISLNVLQIPAKQVQRDGGWKTDAVMKAVYSQSFGSIEQEAFNNRNNYFDNMLK